jgi:hypothetical protein
VTPLFPTITFDFDFRVRSLPAEETITLAFTVRTLEAPSAVSVTGPAAEIAADVVIVAQVTERFPPTVI